MKRRERRALYERINFNDAHLDVRCAVVNWNDEVKFTRIEFRMTGNDALKKNV